MTFSVIVPVYNRPQEIAEFLDSIIHTSCGMSVEVIIVEDGSTLTCEQVVASFSDRLRIKYYYKSNTGPGDSRNFGMRQASGDYFLIFDSDCLLPEHYFSEVERELESDFTDAFGGPDAGHSSFSNLQKAINYAMTSTITTGGVRGKNHKNFQPRSFNFGMSKQAFEKTGGFGNIHPGEDPDLIFRIWKMGLKTRFFPNAFVYHKRRISFIKFYQQVNKFGKARPILDKWHPEYVQSTFILPTLFAFGLVVSVLFCLIGFPYLLVGYMLYFLIVLFLATKQLKNIKIGFLTVVAVAIQFWGYGLGYLQSWFYVHMMKSDPEQLFPELFFKS
jgi:glycosyltransferase involved in cell wall biosynthesis